MIFNGISGKSPFGSQNNVLPEPRIVTVLLRADRKFKSDIKNIRGAGWFILDMAVTKYEYE